MRDSAVPDNSPYLPPLIGPVLIFPPEWPTHPPSFSGPRSVHRYAGIRTSRLIWTDNPPIAEYRSGGSAYSRDWQRMPLFCVFSRLPWHWIPWHWWKGSIRSHTLRKRLLPHGPSGAQFHRLPDFWQ